jgi:chitin disaccharide deacetylase
MDRVRRLCAIASGAALCLAVAGHSARADTLQERLGHPKAARLLVLHADDLGMSHSVNRATLEALEKGWITSASILVPCPWFPEVVRWAREHPEADLGIHLALNSEWTGFRWGPVSSSDGVPSLLDPDGYLPLETEVVAARAKVHEVERELRAQIESARAAGIAFTHLDSHMNALYRTPALFDVYRRLGRAYGVPVLLDHDVYNNAAAKASEEDLLVDRVISMNPGLTVSGWRSGYEEVLRSLPAGTYQLIVHLAYADEEMRGATWDHPVWGAAWRQSDLDLVKSREFRDFLRQQGFVLVSWKELARARRPDRAAPATR